MSAVVSSILNSTVGLLCSKLRDYTSDRLNEGDFTDAQCREIIVREIDEIKSKLDGLSRKDLLASLSCFKEGVNRLYWFLETSGECCDEPNASKTAIENESEVQSITAATRVDLFSAKKAEGVAFREVFELADAIGNLKITSQERYKNAKESFKEARRLATEAFNNVALDTEDRITAGKLRIASIILEGLDDLEPSVRDCLLYLKELHNLPAIQAMVSVWLDSQKGITSRVRARFNKQKRNDNIQSIQLINALLFDLTTKFTKITVALFNWPTIKIGKAIHHPLLEDPECLRRIEDENALLLRIGKLDKATFYGPRAITSKGEILSRIEEGLDITRSGKCETFWLIPSENDDKVRNKILCLTVDENDNVYIVLKSSSITGQSKYKLFILDANGNIKAERFLEIILKGLFSRTTQINVTKDGMIVIFDYFTTPTLYICDSTNTKPDYKLPLPFEKTASYKVSSTVSNNNEIIFTETRCFTSEINHVPVSLTMHIITMDGKLKRSVSIPEATINRYSNCKASVVFNHVNETILVSWYTMHYLSWQTTVPQTTIFTFSKTGERLQQFKIDGKYPCLTSHPKGPIALLLNDEAIMLQM